MVNSIIARRQALDERALARFATQYSFQVGPVPDRRACSICGRISRDDYLADRHPFAWGLDGHKQPLCGDCYMIMQATRERRWSERWSEFLATCGVDDATEPLGGPLIIDLTNWGDAA